MTDTDTTRPAEIPEPTRNNEAAKYRRQLRDTETERDTLRDSLRAARTELLRSALDGYQVANTTFNLDALSDAGLDTDALFTPEGTLNQDALTETMTELATAKPYMFSPPERTYIPAGAEQDELKRALGFDTAFTPKR